MDEKPTIWPFWVQVLFVPLFWSCFFVFVIGILCFQIVRLLNERLDWLDFTPLPCVHCGRPHR